MTLQQANTLAIIGIAGAALSVILWIPFNIYIGIAAALCAVTGGLYGSKIFGSVAGGVLCLNALVSPLTTTAIGTAFVSPPKSRGLPSSLNQSLQGLQDAGDTLAAASNAGALVIIAVGLIVVGLSFWAPLAQPPTAGSESDVASDA